jgi:iron complex transport system permease protein
MVLAVVVLAVVCAASLAIGNRAIDPLDVIRALTSGGANGTDDMVVVDLRLPRTLIGLGAGAALGLAGTLMQGLTRNPLADPGLLGVNAGASLAVVAAITFLGVSSPSSFIWFALAGAAVATVLVYLVAAGRRGATPLGLTLAGTALTAGITSVTTLLLLTNTQTLEQYRFWTVGSLVGRDLDTLSALLPFLGVGAVVALLLGRSLNLLALGDDAARGLGGRIGRTRALAAVAIVLLCGSATAIAGPIVFIGLVVPHVVRRFTGSDYRWILPFSAVAGAALLVTADIVGRVVVPPGELEAGLVVAVIGAPVMIALVRGSRERAL